MQNKNKRSVSQLSQPASPLSVVHSFFLDFLLSNIPDLENKSIDVWSRAGYFFRVRRERKRARERERERKRETKKERNTNY